MDILKKYENKKNPKIEKQIEKGHAKKSTESKLNKEI